MSPAVLRMIEALERCGCKPTQAGEGYKFRCPAHEDHKASGSLSEGADGRALVHCHAGCACDTIVERIGLRPADLFADAPKAERRIIATYDYTDEDGELLYQVVRFEPKDFRQRRPDGAGGWLWNMKDARRVLYRLPELIEAVKAGWTIYLCEGEKDADEINGLESGADFFATCNPGGAGKWRPEYSEALRGAHVIVIADNDEPGRKHAFDIRASLQGVAASAEFKQARTGKDAFDHLAAGHTLADFVPMEGPGAGADSAVGSGSDAVLAPAIDLYDPSIVPHKPDFDVADLIRRSGLHLVWAQPSGGKTWTLLRLCHEMMTPKEVQQAKLMGHPGLWINRRWKRVLWIATEEDAGALRYKADWIKRGLDADELDGTLLYRFAADPKRRLTLDDLEEIIAVDGPLDAIVLDSLTGLRPKTVNGQAVRWDLDNDAANTICLSLRGLTSTHNIAMLLCHHTGRDTSKGYRGPTDWWASADVMFGLVPEDGRTKVIVEKNRDGKRIAPFYLTPTWEGDRYDLAYDGSAAAKLTETGKTVLAWFQGRGQASQAQAIAANLGSRSTVQRAITSLIDGGRLRDTGNVINTSPIYAVPAGAHDDLGTIEDEK